MNRFEDAFVNIKKYLNYIFNDNMLKSNYYKCLNEIYKVLMDTCHKIEQIYYKYVLYPKLCQL